MKPKQAGVYLAKNNWNRDVARPHMVAAFGADRAHETTRTAIAGLERVLVISRIAGQRLRVSHLLSVPCEDGLCQRPLTIVFPTRDPRHHSLALQARIHEIVGALLQVLDTEGRSPATPPPTASRPSPSRTSGIRTRAVEAAGQTYYQFRAQLMVKHDEGLTKTYNRFHDPNETNSDIQTLRELHAVMDRAVLDAYGWTDIPTACEFLLDYEIDEKTWGKKKKPYRYRWPEEVHDEVLARLLDLNQRRYTEEVAAGSHAEKGTSAAAPKKRTWRRAVLPSSNITPLLD